jgi:hypothetical protein
VFERLPFAKYHSEHSCESSCGVSGLEQRGNDPEREMYLTFAGDVEGVGGGAYP